MGGGRLEESRLNGSHGGVGIKGKKNHNLLLENQNLYRREVTGSSRNNISITIEMQSECGLNCKL